MPGAQGRVARRPRASRGWGAGADCGSPGKRSGTRVPRAPRWVPSVGTGPAAPAPWPGAGDRGAPFPLFLRERGRSGYVGPFLCFGKISAAPECYLNSFCLSVPSGVGRNWKLAEMPGAIQPARRGRWGKAAGGSPHGGGTARRPSRRRPGPRAPGPAGTGRAELSWTWTLGARSLQERTGARALRSTACRTRASGRAARAPAGQWAPCPRPRVLRENCFTASKFVRPHRRRRPARGHRPWLRPRHVRARSPTPHRVAQGRPARGHSAVAPDLFSGCTGIRLRGNCSGSFGRGMMAQRPRSTWLAGFPRAQP